MVKNIPGSVECGKSEQHNNPRRNNLADNKVRNEEEVLYMLE